MIAPIATGNIYGELGRAEVIVAPQPTARRVGVRRVQMRELASEPGMKASSLRSASERERCRATLRIHPVPAVTGSGTQAEMEQS